MIETTAMRVKRILSRSTADLVDELDGAQAEGVMTATIRDVERVIDEAREELRRAIGKRLQAVRQAQMSREKVAETERQAREALKASRDDLAKAAIARQLDLEARLVAAAEAERDAANAEHSFERAAAALVARKKEMEESLAAFVAARRDAAPRDAERHLGVRDEAAATSPHRRAEPCAETFRHSVEAAGDMSAIVSIHAETRAKRAELDVAPRQTEIAHRLAALKAGM